MNHLPVCAEQVVHWPYCLDFPSYILDRFFIISSTQKGILFVLLSPSSNILADKPQLAQSLFVIMICASSWALHTRWPLVERKFLLQLKYYEATTFVESYFLGSYQWETTLYISLNCFCIHHAKSYRTLRRKRWRFWILRKKTLYAFRVTFTSVHFTKSS